MKQQTAVEWFNQQINKFNIGTDARVFIAKLFEQAKEMEKQQIEDAYEQGYTEDIPYPVSGGYYKMNAESYYNQKYK